MSDGRAACSDVMLAGMLRIGGEEVRAEAGRTYSLANPATGSEIGLAAEASEADVARAVAAAKAAFDAGAWRRLPAPQRGDILRAAADMISARQEELARLESLCSGKPITDCRAEVQAAARYFRFYGAAVNYMTGQTIPVNATGLDLTLREPIGVCALIVPWNGPIAVAAKKAAPALAAGNSIVLKPAPPTPLTALELESICRAAGVPAGRLQRPDRIGTRGRPAAGGSPRRGEDQLHGQHRHRGRHPRPRRQRHQASQPGARWQVTQRDLRGRRHQGRSRPRPSRRSSPTPVRTAARAAGSSCSGRLPISSSSSSPNWRASVRQGDPLDPDRQARQPDLGWPARPSPRIHRACRQRRGRGGLRRHGRRASRDLRRAMRSRRPC